MKRGVAVFLCFLLLGALGFVLATGGTATNPLITLKYMEDVFGPALLAESGVTSAGQQNALAISAQQHFEERAQQYLAKLGILEDGVSYQSTFADMRVKRGDALLLQSGSGFISYAGDVRASFSAGALIDLTDGVEVASGSILTHRHRYLAAENTAVSFTVTSETAVIAPEGFYTFTASSETDFNQLADALLNLNLFRGSDYAYGSGYELERAPTRVEGLVMFLRLIGEETDALAYTGSSPFTDVAAWSAPYVAYAYDKGYTKGIGEDAYGNPYFAPQTTISANEYMTFLLRALKYDDSGETPAFTWDTALQFGRGQGFITDREYDMLTRNEFLRAHVAYLSYFSLEDKLNNSNQTLKDTLIQKNVFTAAKLKEVSNALNVKRL